MFTGIVAACGSVIRQAGSLSSGGARLAIRADTEFVSEIAIGDSVAINGVCLTAVVKSVDRFEVDCAPVTLERTGIGELSSGSSVNLELAMSANDRFGGHFVTGHVDCVGRVADRIQKGSSVVITVDCGAEFAEQLIPKGSVAVDGISLTVAELGSSSFAVAIIPHTQDATNLSRSRIGCRVNLESDMLGKYVRRYIERSTDETSSSFLEQLRTNGFA